MELVGVAGTGKTTLLERLKEREPRLSEARVGKLQRVNLLLRHTASFLPTFLSHSPRGRWLSWEELRAMAYLQGWQRAARRARTSPLVFDHGPVFRLVELREFGPPLVASAAFAAWWNEQRRAWERAIDLIVWLDAPDEVLVPRITHRAQRHVIKQMPVAAGIEFLAKYRRGYQELLAHMAAAGRLRLMSYDTSKVAAELIAEEVLLAVRSGPGAALSAELARNASRS